MSVTETARRWRWPVGLALLVLAAGAVVALLQPARQQPYLDPAGTGSDGGHALADLATARGQRVVREIAGSPAAPAAPGVELVTGADQLTSAQLARAARFPGDIVVTDPDPAALRVLAPAVTAVAGGQAPVVTAPPLCNDPTANLAGNIEASGTVLRTADSAAATCYPAGGGYFYVRYTGTGRGGNRTVTVLGTGEPFTNAGLAADGDASLALNLLRAGTAGNAGTGGNAITWLLPEPGAIPAGQSRGQRSFASLVPWPAYLVVIQLAIAAGLAAAWRARRLGPLVAEKLPVVVRASETVEGHGRLYTARRARGRAAAELRAAASARIARRTGVAAPLGGPPPATDQELVALADDLDELERKARQQ